MASAPPTEIGHGVTVTVNPEGSIEILSAHLALPLQARQGHVPGTAVSWGGDLFEVISTSRDEKPERFLAFPWRDGEAARRIFRLDDANLALLAAHTREWHEHRRTRRLGTAILPLMGLAPAPLQRAWHNEFGFPMAWATVVSAVPEFLLGITGVIQALVLRMGGTRFLPHGLGWLVPLGAWLALEGTFRLAWALPTGEPLGSVFGLPLLLIPRSRPASAETALRPIALVHDPDGKYLELASPVARHDWSTGTVLPFRGRHWRVLGLRSHAAPWVYAFEACDLVADDAPRAHLAPPRIAELAAASPQPDSLRLIGRRTLETALFAFAPRAQQQRWGTARGTRPVLVTAVCGALEAYGGYYNLHAFGRTDVWLLPHDLAFIAEGLWRVGVALFTRQPCGSLLGLALTSYYRRWRPA